MLRQFVGGVRGGALLSALSVLLIQVKDRVAVKRDQPIVAAGALVVLLLLGRYLAGVRRRRVQPDVPVEERQVPERVGAVGGLLPVPRTEPPAGDRREARAGRLVVPVG